MKSANIHAFDYRSGSSSVMQHVSSISMTFYAMHKCHYFLEWKITCIKDNSSGTLPIIS